LETKKNILSSLKWNKDIEIIQASLTVCVFVVIGSLADIYIRLFGIFFEIPSLITASAPEYLLGVVALSAYTYFILKMKPDIPDWYKVSYKK
jgi:hypothetical protein